MDISLRILTICTIIFFGNHPSISAQDATRDVSKEEREYLSLYLPITGYEWYLSSSWNSVEHTVAGFVANGKGTGHPLHSDQIEQLKDAGYENIKHIVRRCQAGLLIVAQGFVTPYFTQNRSLAKNRLMSMFELQLMAITLPEGQYAPIAQRWREIATPAQWEASHKWVESQYGPERRKKGIQDAHRIARGDFTSQEIAQYPQDSPRDLHDLPLPVFPAPEDQLHFYAGLFAKTYRLNDAQQRATWSIMKEIQKKARSYDSRNHAQLQRLWKQLINIYLFRNEGKITLKQAVRQFRHASQEAIRPFREELHRRLMGLLTSKQKHAAGPPPPKPKWMELMEIALQDDDPPVTAKTKHPAVPTTQSTRSHGQ